jgi:hypothetical protein
MAKTLKESDLDGFSGTEYWHRWSALYPRFLLTDGAKHVADAGEAYWLMDLIASHQRAILRKGDQGLFQVWNIKVAPNKFCTITCDDGNGNILATQDVPYTDFPLPELKLYAISDDGSNLTILLPGEY